MGTVKATAEKNPTASATHAEASRQPFIGRAGGGDFFQRVQAKMTGGNPGDKFEQEADNTADNVMRMPAPQAAGSGGGRRASSARNSSAGGAGAPTVSGNVQSAIHSKTTGGEPLASDVRGNMEQRFNVDFGNVRVHSDAEFRKSRQPALRPGLH